METETLITLTSDIVSAHVSNNSVAVNDLPSLIQSIYGALASVGAEDSAVAEESPLVPAVSVRVSVKPDVVTCLDCGKKMKLLKKHLMSDHGLSPKQYRERWNLASDHPLVAPDYASKRAELAKSFGLGRKSAKKAPAKGSKAKPVAQG